MFNLGLPEVLVIGSAVLLLFGPKRLPELARGLGEGIRGFKEELNGKDSDSSKTEEPPESSTLG